MNKLFSTFKTFLATSSVLVLAACPSGNAPQSKPSAQGQNTVSRPAPKPKATVALALGGGASKGFAHIGIIKVLKENNIPVKIVTGTSAGSIVGSMYASGMSPDRLKFAAVATDFESGKPVVFNVGNAGQAVRASASIPNVFQPVVIGSRKYVDGGLSQPVPVSAAKKLGANFIIAVDISARPAKNVSQGMFSYLDQTFNVMSQTALRQELGQANVVIKPQVLELGSVGGFDQKQRAIQLGEQAARAALPEIKRKLAAYQY